MLHMIPLFPVGLPGLAVIAVSFVSFVIALLIARRRAGVRDTGQGQRSEKSWAGIIVQTIGIFAVGFGPVIVSLDPLGTPALLQALVVGLLMVSAIWLFAASSRAMGSNWAIVASTRSDHELVTSGPFAYVRNPIYIALFLFMIAMAVAYGHYAGLIIGVPLYVIGTMMRVTIEEKLLRTQFGAAYDAYVAKVRRFIPGVI
jgi:protein-S-isoprenylcysteine O-methyltransferase Ste14